MSFDTSVKVRVNDEETIVLRELSSKVPENGLIVEIGSAWGHSTVNMAQSSHGNVRIFAIDSWGLIEKWAINEQRFLDNTKPYWHRITRIKSFSKDVKIQEWLNGDSIDLLFIDGDHHENACRDDYLLYSPYVKQGGLLVFHDYGMLAGVTKAVMKYVVPSGLWENVEIKQRLWIGRKT